MSEQLEPLPFHLLSAQDFERLCQRLVECEGFQQVSAQTTVEGFHFDLTAQRGNEYWDFECRQARQLDLGSALTLIERLNQLSGEFSRPTHIVFIVSGEVSDDTRTRAQRRCKEMGLDCQFWYGSELDSRLRQYADILVEFFGLVTMEDTSEKSREVRPSLDNSHLEIDTGENVQVRETVEAGMEGTLGLSGSLEAVTVTPEPASAVASTSGPTVVISPPTVRAVTIDDSSVVSSATSDQPIRSKEQDQLGFDVYAEALAAFISSEETTTPLVIGIDAPWGYGKTSLMRMIESELSPDRPWYQDGWLWLKLRIWRIRWFFALLPWGLAKAILWLAKRAKRDTSAGFVTLSSWLESVVTRTTAPGQTIHTTSADRRRSLAERVLRWCVRARLPIEARHPTIWFNAWKFDDEEALWSALAVSILDQIRNHYGWPGRFLFWLRLSVKRFRHLRAWEDVAQKILLPASLGFVAWGWAQFSGQIDWPIPNSGLVLKVFLWTGAILTAGVQLKAVIQDPFSLSFREYIQAPKYREKIGFLGEFEEDFRRIVEIATRKVWGWRQRRLVIFIDDLDRCEPPRPADVIEAINVFLDSPNCVFVIGMDSRAVVASIETKYEPLFKRAQSESPDQPSLGRCFLDKIVQISFALPPAQDRTMGSLVKRLIGPRPDDTSEPVPADGASRIGDAGVTVPPEKESVGSPAGRERRPDVGSYRENAAVWDAINKGVGYLETNPRQVKRFINLFRLHLYIAHARGLFRELVDQDKPQSGYTLDSMAAWVALSMRWPRIVSCLQQESQRADLQRRLFWVAQLVESNDTWIGRESLVAKKKENHLEKELAPLVPEDGIESDELGAFLVTHLSGRGNGVSEKDAGGSGSGRNAAWSTLPWDRWLRSQDFLRVIKVLEEWWREPESAEWDWLTMALLCGEPTVTGVKR